MKETGGGEAVERGSPTCPGALSCVQTAWASSVLPCEQQPGSPSEMLEVSPGACAGKHTARPISQVQWYLINPPGTSGRYSGPKGTAGRVCEPAEAACEGMQSWEKGAIHNAMLGPVVED